MIIAAEQNFSVIVLFTAQLLDSVADFGLELALNFLDLALELLL